MFEYDGGRLIRTVTTREPEWTPEERAYLLASRRIEFEPKNKFGIPLSESMDVANQFRWKPFTLPSIDWAEKAHGDAIDQYYKEWPEVSRNGHLWRAPILTD